jgi:hypothetical protein
VITAKSGELVNRRVDAWLVGWLGVAIWALILAGHTFGLSLSTSTVTTLFWIGATVNAAHFGLSYHLAYGDGGRGMQARRFALVWFPAVFGASLIAFVVLVRAVDNRTVEYRVAGALVTSVFLLTGWHYVKQAYGVGRVGLALAGVRISKGEADVLRFGLYPLWILNAGQVLIAVVLVDGYVVGYELLPSGAASILRWVAAVAMVPIVVVLVRIGRRGRLPSILLATYASALLWFVVPVETAATVIALPALHALQYLAIGHRAELGLATARGQSTTSLWWLNIFLGVACGGLLASRWLPGLVDRTIDPAAPLLFSACFFVFLNLHHYVMDATIWKSGGPLVRAVVSGGPPVEKPAPEPALAGH